MSKLKLFCCYVLDRMGEASTWQGVGFLVTAFGSKFGAGLDWGGAAFVGGFVSAAIKSMFPDTLK